MEENWTDVVDHPIQSGHFVHITSAGVSHSGLGARSRSARPLGDETRETTGDVKEFYIDQSRAVQDDPGGPGKGFVVHLFQGWSPS